MIGFANRQVNLRPPDKRSGKKTVQLRFPMGELPAGAVVEHPIRLADKLIFNGFAVALDPRTKQLVK